MKLSYAALVPVDRARYSDENCSIRRTLDVIGERWTLLILREAFYGVRRFEELVRGTGCPRNVLSDRLRTLVEQEVLARTPYKEPGRRARSEYRLTDKGRELYPLLVALMQWGDRWSADPPGPAVILSHTDCGQPLGVSLTCAAGHGPLGHRDVTVEPGPGARLIAA